METDQRFPAGFVRLHPERQQGRFSHDDRNLIEVHDVMGIRINIRLVMPDGEFEGSVPGDFFL